MHDVRSWVEHLCQNDIRMCVSYIIEFFVFRTKTRPSVVGRNHIGRMSASLHELSLLSEMDCLKWLEHLWFQVMGCCQNKDMFQLSTVVVLTGVLGTDQLDWLFVQIIWQSIQMLYFFVYLCPEMFANSPGLGIHCFPQTFHPQPPGFESSLQMAVISIVFDMISWYPLMPNC